ncbi:MAG: hypothetical protein H0X62_12860 [Bacteroidetes bacterium]|nr:hypothetical protein [Bacteroidota bacterium]
MILNSVSILIVALSGLVIIFYAVIKRVKKEKKEQPYDPHKDDPVTQINKKLFLEIPVEKIASGYFFIISLIYIGKIIAGALIPGLSLTVLYLSGLIFLLLIYKMAMALTVVKKFSPWIFFTILFSGLIFIMAIAGLEIHLNELLRDARRYNMLIHLLGLALGLGGTFTVDIAFTHYLRKYKITQQDSVLMHLISQMIILGLILLILSGFALLLPFTDRLLDSPAFLMKMLVVFFVIVNGAALNLYVTPKMKHISLLEEEKGKHETLKKVSFALGAISIISWLSAFLLIMLRELDGFSFITLLGAFLALMAIGIAGSQFAKVYYEDKEGKGN